MRELEVELRKEQDQIAMYLNVYGIPLKVEPDQTSLITFKIDDENFTYHAHLFEGNQRILLPSEAQKRLLEAFKRHADITITTGKYSTKIIYEGFEKTYDKFYNT